MASRANKKPRSVPVRVFGCEACSLMIFQAPEVDSMVCPWCQVTLDIHVTYQHVAFAYGVKIRLNNREDENTLLTRKYSDGKPR